VKKATHINAQTLHTAVQGFLAGMARMDTCSRARCLLFDRKHHPEIARELEKHLNADVIALANLLM